MTPTETDFEKEFLNNIVATADDDSIPYQGVAYERSAVKYAHVNLKEYLEERGLADTEIAQADEKFYSLLPPGSFVAGGAVARWVCDGGTVPSDVDVFFSNGETLEKAYESLKAAGYSEDPSSHVPLGVRQLKPPTGTHQLPIQLICIGFFPEGIEQVVDGFDFTVCQFGIDVATRELVYNPASPIDYAKRWLLNHRCEGDIASNKRLAKYIAKGFKPVGKTLERAIELRIVKP